MKDRKILIAVRNYETPNLVAAYAANVAKLLDRETLLLGSAKTPMFIGSTGVAAARLHEFETININEIKKNREKELKKIARQTKKIQQETDYDIEIGFHEAILRNKVIEEKPYMVAIEGNSELTTLSDWFGTYETRLAEDIQVPVLVIPEKMKWKPVNEILYIMKMDENNAKSIRSMVEIAKKLSANLHVMLISEKNDKEEIDKYNHIVNTIQQFYNYNQARFSLATNVDSAGEIIKLTEQMQVDWLAFDHQEKSFLERVFSNLSTARLILKAEIPVLVF